MSHVKKHTPWIVFVAIGVLILVAVDTWWIATYRHGYPLTIDEAGYISIGLIDHFGLQTGGLHGWWEAIQTQIPQAPLVPALTSLVLNVKPGVLEAFEVLTAFVVLLVFAAYGIGARLAGPRLGALAALIVACAPGTFLFAREYVFALPAAALLSCAVYALLCSDGLRSRRWALACGVTIGLMLLTRSMAIGYVPGVLVAAVVGIWIRGWLAPGGRQQIGRRLVNLALLVIASVAVAATWYARNFKPVYEYLTGFGYGANSAYYGPNHSLLSWDRWRDVATRIAYNDLLLPLSVLLLLGIATVVVVAARRVYGAQDRRPVLLSLAGSDAFSVAIVFICGYLALTSTRNGGEGFTFPIMVLLPPLAVVSLRHLSRNVIVPALAVLALVMGLNIISSTNLSDTLARTRVVSVPGFGSLPWINGTPQAVGAIRAQVPGPYSHFDASDRGWPEADEALAKLVVESSEKGIAHEPVAFASRNRALNTSTLQLAGLLSLHRSFFLVQLSAEPADTVASYVHQLSSPEFGLPGVLITMSSSANDSAPVVNQRYAEAAARKTGFHKIKTMHLPDGRLMRVWGRPSQ
jgi:hypothetical protein